MKNSYSKRNIINGMLYNPERKSIIKKSHSKCKSILKAWRADLGRREELLQDGARLGRRLTDYIYIYIYIYIYHIYSYIYIYMYLFIYLYIHLFIIILSLLLLSLSLSKLVYYYIIYSMAYHIYIYIYMYTVWQY